MMREPPVARPPRAPQDFDINDAIREKLYDFNRAVRIIFSHNPRLALVYRGNTGKYMAIVTYTVIIQILLAMEFIIIYLQRF